jgi:hypothetical protein
VGAKAIKSGRYKRRVCPRLLGEYQQALRG